MRRVTRRFSQGSQETSKPDEQERTAATNSSADPDPSSGWTRSTHFVAPTGRHVYTGTEVSIKGERGTFRFIEHVVTREGTEWVSVIGGPKGVRTWRAFPPKRIRSVHIKKTHMTGKEAQALLKKKRAEKKSAA